MTPASTLSLDGYSILIVEDSPTQAHALQVLLEMHGAVATIVKSGEDALALLRLVVTNNGQLEALPKKIDLVLSDVIMPGMSGFDLSRAIKSDDSISALPVILLTSLTDPTDVIRGLESGADNYITKPYDSERLVERLLHVFRNQMLRQQGSDAAEVGITFLGEQFTVTSSKEHILDFLVSSFEDLVRTNDALRASETERAQLYERERQARMEAEGANQAKSEFLASMSHDLRTPLNAIGGYTALMMEEVQGPINDGQRSYLERVIRNQKHLLALVTDILNFARVERGQVSVELIKIPVASLFSGIRAMIEPQVLAKGLKFKAQSCNPLLTVLADRERTDQIIMNLLGNAVKFTPQGGEITVTCEETNDTVSINVSDTGLGIPHDRLDAIFDPFVQVDASRANEQQGVGLGLAISRNLARLMNGELTVTSTLGEGSTFSLQLPRVMK